MPVDISPTSGQPFYSGSWENIKYICTVLKIGDGRLARITQQMVNHWQEQTDRAIDGQLERYYYVPLQQINLYQKATSLTISMFPSAIIEASRYWTSGALLLSEFQQLEQNITDQATSFITESKQKIYDVSKFNHRLEGQRWKHNLRSAPPAMMPGYSPETNW